MSPHNCTCGVPPDVCTHNAVISPIYWVECWNCERRGAIVFSHEEAVVRWNNWIDKIMSIGEE